MREEAELVVDGAQDVSGRMKMNTSAQVSCFARRRNVVSR